MIKSKLNEMIKLVETECNKANFKDSLKNENYLKPFAHQVKTFIVFYVRIVI